MSQSTEFDTKNLKNNRAGRTREIGGRGEEGVYEHPEARNEDGSPRQVICLEDPLFGNAQANAAIQLGYVRVGDVDRSSLKTLTGDAILNQNKERDSVAGISARLARLEDDNSAAVKRAEAAEQESAELREKLAAFEAANPEEEEPTEEEATAAAVEKFNSGKSMNATELKLVAKAEGVELTEDIDTNKKITDAILQARSEKGNE